MLLFERKIFMGALLVLAIFLNNGCKVYSLQYTIFDAAAEILNATGGVIESIPKSIPKPEDFFEMGKNAVLGYPAVVAMEMVNTFCKNHFYYYSCYCDAAILYFQHSDIQRCALQGILFVFVER